MRAGTHRATNSLSATPKLKLNVISVRIQNIDAFACLGALAGAFKWAIHHPQLTGSFRFA
jgi:hypothetical protein